MKTALSWIKAYVPDLNCSNQEYMDAMTLTGTKVEGYEELDRNLEKIVVGRIESIEKHPDADKLIVCQVNIGSETVQIVTGASNVNVNDLVPVVLDGGKVAGGHSGEALPKDGIKIKKGKLRGIESFGMMCSVEELGTTREAYPEAPENGIYIFDESVEVGMDAIEAFGLHDSVFEYEITSNRVDCYSVLGIAREAAATFGLAFHSPAIEVLENNEKVSDYIQVAVEDADLCPRYIARVCKNVKIGPSPKWMQRRLVASGIRPINNLVDITNYVMEEFGQPMHAFDLDLISGNQIIVRRAKEGELFQTLDGQQRVLDQEMLMICDKEKAIGIAGIMGGENSKITDEVKTVLFEAATFQGVNIRKSAKRLGLRTDASGKFEKGLDPRNAELAINRACQLMMELGCGEVVGGMVDVCQPLKELREIPFEENRINQLLGTAISKEEMTKIFMQLELQVDPISNMVIIPSFRQDLEGIADLAEEVARFFGYDKIPSTLPTGEATTGKMPFKLRIEEKAKDMAQYYGFSQGMCYSFESPKVFDKLILPKEDQRRQAIVISNPLGEDFSVMRTISLNGILTSLATNYNRRNKDVRLYELGNIYIAKELPLVELPDERMQFTLGFYGDGDFYTLKGVVESFFESIGMKQKPMYQNNQAYPFLHPGRQADIYYNNQIVGYLGEVHPEVLDNYDLGAKAYVCVLDMKEVEPFASFERKYEGVPKYPAVSRDLSMVVPKTILAGQIEQVMEKCGGKLLESCELFDLYEGAQIKEGFKSIAYNLKFRAKDKTLDEQEVNDVMKKILGGLEALSIELRQ